MMGGMMGGMMGMGGSGHPVDNYSSMTQYMPYTTMTAEMTSMMDSKIPGH